MLFSPDGRDLLVNTGTSLHLLNSFDANLRLTLSLPSTPLLGDACFSPDGRYVISGSHEDRAVHVWNLADKGRLLTHNFEGHSGIPGLVKFNPTKLMFASACSNLVIIKSFVIILCSDV